MRYGRSERLVALYKSAAVAQRMNLSLQASEGREVKWKEIRYPDPSSYSYISPPHQHVVMVHCFPIWSPIRNPHSPLVIGEMSSYPLGVIGP